MNGLQMASSLAPRLRPWGPLFLLPVFAGCLAPPVSDLGEGRHHLAVRAEHGESGLDVDRVHAGQLADEYCRKSGQRAKIERYDAQGPFAASPAVGVVFSCEQPSHEEMPHHSGE
jgi:hypothetical protein